MSKPLEGIRVLDLTNVLAGPFCCHHLAHMGAEVIKVEARGRGDLARQLGADPELNASGMGVSFLAQNAGKKSVTVNLKHPEGKALFLRLVATADVVVENFRPGVMTRLGVGYDVLKAVNPHLIYCAISGFGQDGPWVHRPAYDQIVQGASGVMSITGDGESAPLRVGYPVADTVGGITAAFAISAALNATPRGSMIDVSMLESVLATMGWVVSNYLIAGVEPLAHGNENPTSAPSGAFEAGEGLINIAANKDEQWQLLAGHLGLSHLCARPEYASREARKANRRALKAELETVLKTRPARDWAKELNRIGVPAGAVLTVPEILAMPQVADRGFLHSYADVPGVGRDIQVATTGIKLDGAAPAVETPPPELGQHNAEIWQELGLSTEDIDTLQEDGAI
ncbi:MULTISPECIES: CaiB/BaiF CoA transferase family protein [Roseobacteraceae]|jgi:crotonobetainyl-CoA:carnitine CoA-transferase CaiB-like acyl-CoA transferase|uniref:Formyl-CoA transferase n=1 Tax=Marinovum algicola TaxID=42444 RepID=A0A975WA91_9RHOB|nr:CoA transferase [Marinovum algicola]SEJ50969.1 formyl-CoA transferase [Marinovum algicola]SLN32691.1 Formyl-coenzyme A transferase [Marinovum algicola]